MPPRHGGGHRPGPDEPALLFRAGAGAPQALPLALVTRLEEIPAARIEMAAGAGRFDASGVSLAWYPETMIAPASRPSVLVSPSQGQHIAQLYTDPAGLARAAGQFVGEGLRRGEGVLLVATPRHWDAIGRRLAEDGLALEDLEHRGQLTRLDAAECLAGILVNGWPDRERFLASIGGRVDAARERGFRDLRAFGEMVDLLRRVSLEATVRLEELWGELLATRGVSLLCAYSLDNFDRHTHRSVLPRVIGTHSDLIPAEDDGRLERAVARAYVDVFGPGADTDVLRRLFLDRYPRTTVMPEAQASILAVRALVPRAADLLLERVSEHYRSTTSSAA